MVDKIQQIIDNIKNHAESDVQNLIVELQKNRFAHQGEFNDNKRWADNQKFKGGTFNGITATHSVIQDKGRNEPLVDSGHLKSELTNPKNWNLSTKKGNNKIQLTIPQTEKFTEMKYDKLQTGTDKPQSYISSRGNAVVVDKLPARNFKDLSDQDAEWIVNKLVNIIVQEIKE